MCNVTGHCLALVFSTAGIALVIRGFAKKNSIWSSSQYNVLGFLVLLAFLYSLLVL